MSAGILRPIGLAAFYAYLASLFALGLMGLMLPRFELESFYGLSFDGWDDQATATLIHQYRILKAFVLGFALFGWLFRREIFRLPKYNRLFLFLMVTESLARPLSLFLDGRPVPGLLAFTAIEFLLLFAVLVYSRSALRK